MLVADFNLPDVPWRSFVPDSADLDITIDTTLSSFLNEVLRSALVFTERAVQYSTSYSQVLISLIIIQRLKMGFMIINLYI